MPSKLLQASKTSEVVVLTKKDAASDRSVLFTLRTRARTINLYFQINRPIDE